MEDVPIKTRSNSETLRSTELANCNGYIMHTMKKLNPGLIVLFTRLFYRGGVNSFPIFQGFSKIYDYTPLLVRLPVHLCTLFLVLKFGYLLFKEVRRKWFRPATNWSGRRVRILFVTTLNF